VEGLEEHGRDRGLGLLGTMSSRSLAYSTECAILGIGVESVAHRALLSCTCMCADSVNTRGARVGIRDGVAKLRLLRERV
jgi:hypothetical protein